MWPLNFLALLVVGVWFTRSPTPTGVWSATSILAASVLAALAWAWLFYVLTGSAWRRSLSPWRRS